MSAVAVADSPRNTIRVTVDRNEQSVLYRVNDRHVDIDRIESIIARLAFHDGSLHVVVRVFHSATLNDLFLLLSILRSNQISHVHIRYAGSPDGTDRDRLITVDGFSDFTLEVESTH